MAKTEKDRVNELVRILIGEEEMPVASLEYGGKAVHLRVGYVDGSTRSALGLSGDVSGFTSGGREFVAVLFDDRQEVVAAFVLPPSVFQLNEEAREGGVMLLWDERAADHLLSNGTLQSKRDLSVLDRLH